VKLAICVVGIIAIGCKCNATDARPEAGVEARAPRQVEPPRAVLPPSDRVFAARGSDPERDLVIAEKGGSIFCAEPEANGEFRVLWRNAVPGELQAVATGENENSRVLYAAFGAGSSRRDAPLTIERIDLAGGGAETLWQWTGERNETTHLSITDSDNDGHPDLVFAHFITKFEVQERHVAGDGGVVDDSRARMALSRAFGDFDGDGTVDEAVGRLYGDVATSPGDLSVHMGGRTVSVPTERGVRAIVIRQPKPGRGEIYFSDGWDADYGRVARAQLKLARWNGERFDVETIGRSGDEYTFYQLFAIDGPGERRAIIARGNVRVTIFEAPDWRATPLSTVGETDTIAAGHLPGGRLGIYLPGKDGTRVLGVLP
jgi:hypothetical protein